MGIYLLKVNNRNTKARCEICSKLTISFDNLRFRSNKFVTESLKFERPSLIVAVLEICYNKRKLCN